jgi:inosine-uridine nucleoside N-ribohydrolase
MGSIVDESQKQPGVEFNFGLDPESNAIFLNSLMHNKILVMPWDVALKQPIEKVF